MDTFNLGHSVASVSGNTGADIFNVNASVTANLAGGAGADSFVFADGAALTGTVDGGADSDTLNLSAYTAATDVTLTASAGDGYSGTVSAVTGGFSTIDVLTGGTLSNTLTGLDAVAAWTTSAANAGSYVSGGNTLTFSNYDTWSGGSNVDTFNLGHSVASVSGNAGADVFNVNASVTADLSGGDGIDTFDIGATLTGSIDGEAGADILQGSAIDAVVLTGSDVDGFAGTEADITGNFDGIVTLTGNGGTLTGRNVASTWALDGTPTYNDGANTLNFSGFANLQGGTNTDAFSVTAASAFNLLGGDGIDTFSIDATLTGSIDGEAGADVLQGNLIDAVVLTGSDADGFAGTEASISLGFDGIATLTGNAGTLTGENVASTWALDGTPTYNDGANTLNFSGFANLQGGTNTDAFNVTAASTFNLLGGAGDDIFNLDADAGSLSGSIDGGLGADTLSYAGTSAAVSVTLASSGANGFTSMAGPTGIAGTFANISTLTGGDGATDALTGRNVNSTWTLSGTPAYFDGANTLNFSAFEIFNGGAGNDTFNASVLPASATINGGGGTDAFNISGTIAMAGNLTVTAETLNNLGGNTITANQITIDGATAIGALGLPIQTNVNVLTITASNADTFIAESSGIDLATINIGSGDLNLTAGGLITQSGALTIGGTTTIANAGSNISLNNVTNNFVGAVAVTGANVILVDANAIDLGAGTVTGAFSVTATAGGDITNSGALNISGAATFTAANGRNISVDNVNNIFNSTVTFIASSGTLNNVSILDTTALVMPALTVANNLTAQGAGITQSGTLVVPNIATFTSTGANDVTLTSPSNDFGTAAVTSGQNATLVDANAVVLGAHTIAGNLSWTTGGAVTQSAPLNVAGTTTIVSAGSNITLNNAGNDFSGAVAVTGANVQIADANVLDIGASTMSGSFAATAGGGVIVSGAVNSAGSFSSSGTTFDNTAGSVTTTNSPITINHNGAVSLGTIDAGSSSISLSGSTINGGTLTGSSAVISGSTIGLSSQPTLNVTNLNSLILTGQDGTGTSGLLQKTAALNQPPSENIQSLGTVIIAGFPAYAAGTLKQALQAAQSESATVVMQQLIEKLLEDASKADFFMAPPLLVNIDVENIGLLEEIEEDCEKDPLTGECAPAGPGTQSKINLPDLKNFSHFPTLLSDGSGGSVMPGLIFSELISGEVLRTQG